MGLSDLCLVKPSRFPDAQAEAMASGADDVLQNAAVVNSLSKAVADCQLIIGTSARSQRTLRWIISEPRQCGEAVSKHASRGKVAIVFGRERTGLTNEELELCHQLVHIPSNPDYSSLNVASAVQILSYECRVAHLNALVAPDSMRSCTLPMIICNSDAIVMAIWKCQTVVVLTCTNLPTLI